MLNVLGVVLFGWSCIEVFDLRNMAHGMKKKSARFVVDAIQWFEEIPFEAAVAWI